MRSVCGAGISVSPLGPRSSDAAEAGAEQPAVGLREQRLRDLVALLLDPLRVERVQPDVDAVLDVADRRGEEPGAEREQRQPDDHEREPVGGHVEQRQEAAEEHQRRAEVADEDEHQHRRAPDHEQRAEVLERRDRHARSGAPCTSTCRVSRRYAARKMTIAIFPNSAGWNATGPELDAEVGAVDLLADPGHARQQQQQQADERRSCSGSARARGSRAAAGSSPRTGPGRRRTTAPARAPASRRSGR